MFFIGFLYEPQVAVFVLGHRILRPAHFADDLHVLVLDVKNCLFGELDLMVFVTA